MFGIFFSGKIGFDLGIQEARRSLSNSFNFYVLGGNVALAARVAEAQENSVNTAPVAGSDEAAQIAAASADAVSGWLKSIKTSPSVFKYDFGRLPEFLQIAANSPGRVAKLTAIQFAIDVYMREGDPTSTILVYVCINKCVCLILFCRSIIFILSALPRIGVRGNPGIWH